MVLQGFKKLIWLLLASTILSSIFSIAMLSIGLKSHKEIMNIKRDLSGKSNKTSHIDQYRNTN